MKEDRNPFKLIVDAISNQETELALEDSGLDYLPKAIFEIISLETLWLDDNKFEYLKESDFNGLERLINLKDFSCYQSDLAFFPHQLYHLPNLKEICLFWNKIGKIPYGISKLKKLKLLDLNGNPLNNFPLEIIEADSLEILRISNANISEIPIDIYKLSNLSEFEFNDNKIYKLPKSILKLKKLEEISYSENNFDVELPISGSGNENIRKILTDYFQRRKEYLKNKIEEFIAEHEVDKAIIFFLKEGEVESSIKDSLLLLSSRKKAIERQKIDGIISEKVYQLEINK
jgi:Leucine-rich repeat (LRR) protein